MNRPRKKERGLGISIAGSFFLHAALLASFSAIGLYPSIKQSAEPVYYVDIANLPVANPRSGSPGGEAAEASPPPKAQQQEAMRVPPSAAKPVPSKASKTPAKDDSSKDFQERLAKLERKVGRQHAESAMDELRKRVAAQGGGRSGMPGGTGTEAGSDYASYIQSRLRDAFKMTIAHQSRKPEVVVQMFISRYGKLSSYRILRSSGDKVFEDAVARAIHIAAENFPPPPNRKEFQQGFIFRPEGLEKK